jgi:hypothetical protein
MYREGTFGKQTNKIKAIYQVEKAAQERQGSTVDLKVYLLTFLRSSSLMICPTDCISLNACCWIKEELCTFLVPPLILKYEIKFLLDI